MWQCRHSSFPGPEELGLLSSHTLFTQILFLLEKRCASLPLIAKFSQAKGSVFSLLMICRENLINGDLWGSSQEGYMPDFPNSATVLRILSPALSQQYEGRERGIRLSDFHVPAFHTDLQALSRDSGFVFSRDTSPGLCQTSLYTVDTMTQEGVARRASRLHGMGPRVSHFVPGGLSPSLYEERVRSGAMEDSSLQH